VGAAGRTDAGVHAEGQVVQLDLTRDWPAETVRNALNAHLVPAPVAVLAVEPAPEDWSARFSATGRRYRYRILNRAAPPALDQGRVWHVKKPLDAEAMHAAAQVLVGHHDFTTFRDLACQAKSPIKTLDVANVRREGAEVVLEFASRSFLHRQVRSMAGTLAEVGVGRWSRQDVADALAARDRKACGPVAPAHGLYLTRVDYA
jgi:tRNA pseudouridine38-40 synthase